MTKKTIYVSNHPETGEEVKVNKGGRPVLWLTWWDKGDGRGFVHVGYSSAPEKSKADQALKGSLNWNKEKQAANPNVRFTATPAREYVPGVSGPGVAVATQAAQKAPQTHIVYDTATRKEMGRVTGSNMIEVEAAILGDPKMMEVSRRNGGHSTRLAEEGKPVPPNFLYMAKHAETEANRKWWQKRCDNWEG